MTTGTIKEIKTQIANKKTVRTLKLEKNDGNQISFSEERTHKEEFSPLEIGDEISIKIKNDQKKLI